jgi:hypothetical protein
VDRPPVCYELNGLDDIPQTPIIQHL